MGEFLEMTSAQFRNLVSAGSSPYKKPELIKKNKFNNKKTESNGILYDSKKEANRGDVLKLLESQGKITNLERQKPFILIEPFKYHGETIRGTKWLADFYYFDCERETWVAEDVKSPATRQNAEYIIKKKLFMIRYPEILFEEFI